MQNNHLGESQGSDERREDVRQHEDTTQPSSPANTSPETEGNTGNQQLPGEFDRKRPYRGGYHDNYRRNDNNRRTGQYPPRQQYGGQRDSYGNRSQNPQRPQYGQRDAYNNNRPQNPQRSHYGQQDNIGNRQQYPSNQNYGQQRDRYPRQDNRSAQSGGYNRQDGQRRDYPPRNYNSSPRQEQYPRRAGQYPPRQEGGGYGNNNNQSQNRRFDGGNRRDFEPNRYGDKGGNDQQQRGRTLDAPRNRKTGVNPRPVTLVKALRRLDFASPKIALRAVQSGSVAVNGETVMNPNTPVNRQKDSVSAHGMELRIKHENMYVVLHKMRGAAGSQEEYGRSIYQNFYHPHHWFFPVGCLDKNSSGIIILTTDPQHKAPKVTPITELEKEYHCKVHRAVPPEEVPELQRFLDELLSEDVGMFILRRNTRTTFLSLTVVGATPAKIRAALKRYGLEILSFNRYRVGTFTAEELPAGAWRQLTPDEIVALNEFAIFSAQRNRTASSEAQTPAVAAQQDKEHKSLTEKMQTLYRQFFKS